MTLLPSNRMPREVNHSRANQAISRRPTSNVFVTLGRPAGAVSVRHDSSIPRS